MPPRKPRNPPPLSQADRDFNLKLHTRNLIASSFNTVVRAGTLLGIAYLGYLSIRSLAGQYTIADIGIKVLANMKISEAAAWLFGLGGVGYGIAQRRFRLKANQALGTRVSELEHEIDPERSSSRLTASGQTNPADSL